MHTLTLQNKKASLNKKGLAFTHYAYQVQVANPINFEYLYKNKNYHIRRVLESRLGALTIRSRVRRRQLFCYVSNSIQKQIYLKSFPFQSAIISNMRKAKPLLLVSVSFCFTTVMINLHHYFNSNRPDLQKLLVCHVSATIHLMIISWSDFLAS